MRLKTKQSHGLVADELVLNAGFSLKHYGKFIDEKFIFTKRRFVITSDSFLFIFMAVVSIDVALLIEQLFWYLSGRSI